MHLSHHFSAMFVKKRRDLTDALSITPAILKNQFSDSGLVTDYRDWQIPLGRRFRALKVWFVLRTYGTAGIKEHIRNHIRIGKVFSDLVRTRPGLFELVTEPAFALTVLTAAPPALMGQSDKNEHLGINGTEQVNGQLKEARILSNEATRRVYERINEGKEFFLTSTVVGDTYAIRVVSASQKAEEKYLRLLFDLLVETTEQELAQGRQAKPSA